MTPSGVKGTAGQEQSEMISRKFERRLVLKYDAKISKQKGNDQYLIRCDCGVEKVVSGGSLRRRYTKSCGCLMREVNKNRNQKGENNPAYVHGFRATKEHRETIRRRDKYKCQRYGKTQKQELIDTGKSLSVHHKDGDHYNDDPKNETSLCIVCHNIIRGELKNVFI